MGNFLSPNKTQVMEDPLQHPSDDQETHLLWRFSRRHLREHAEGQRFLPDLTTCLLSNNTERVCRPTQHAASVAGEYTAQQPCGAHVDKVRKKKGEHKVSSLPTEGIIINTISKVLTRADWKVVSCGGAQEGTWLSGSFCLFDCIGFKIAPLKGCVPENQAWIIIDGLVTVCTSQLILSL